MIKSLPHWFMSVIIFAKGHLTEAIDLSAELTCYTGVNAILL